MDRRVVLVAGGFVVGIVIAVLAWPRPRVVHHEHVVIEHVTVARPLPPLVPQIAPLQHSGLRGTIVDIHSKPTVGRFVIEGVQTYTTDATGRFEIELPPGHYELGADLPERLRSPFVVEPGQFTERKLVTADGRVRIRAR